MRRSLKEKCDMFISNKEIAKEGLRWENITLQILCAYLYTKENKQIDIEKIKKCKKIIKNNTGFFSYFRSSMYISFATLLSLDDNPMASFRNVLESYNTILTMFEEDISMPLPAFAMTEYANREEEYEKMVCKSEELCLALKDEKKIVNNALNKGLMLLYGMSDSSKGFLVNECETCANVLSKFFNKKELVEPISQIVMFGKNDYTMKCENILNVTKQLMEKKIVYCSEFELSMISWLVLLNEDTDDIVDDLIEVNMYLKSKSGFGLLIGNEFRQMYAAAIVGKDYIFNNEKKQRQKVDVDILENKIPHFILQSATIKYINEKKGQVN